MGIEDYIPFPLQEETDGRRETPMTTSITSRTSKSKLINYRARKR